MTDARLTGDTVAGLVNGRLTAIPLSRLTAVRAVVRSSEKTVALAMAVGGAVTVALIMTHPWNDDEGVSIKCVPDPESPGLYDC